MYLQYVFGIDVLLEVLRTKAEQHERYKFVTISRLHVVCMLVVQLADIHIP